MNTRNLLAIFHRSAAHSEFWGPGLIILFISIFSLSAGAILGAGSAFVKFGLIGLVISMLLLFRTRIGTTLYFCLLFWLAIQRYEEDLGLSTVKQWLGLGLALLIFGLLSFIGWQQIQYHFAAYRCRHSACSQRKI